MRKKVIRFLTLALLAAVVAAAGFAAKLFLIGESMDMAQVQAKVETEQNGDILTVNVCSAESAAAFRGWKVRRDGDAAYVSLRKVLVSPLYRDGVVEYSLPLEGAKEVWFGGKLIWERETEG